MFNGWLRIELSYATFAVVIKDNVVVEAAPIARWMIGHTQPHVEAWVKRKGGTCQELGESEVLHRIREDKITDGIAKQIRDIENEQILKELAEEAQKYD